MRPAARAAVLLCAGLFSASLASAQTPVRAWSVDASLFTYFAPEEEDYVQPTLALDRDWLHAEVRYNYEDFDTVSLWFGYNLSAGTAVTFEFTPMVGAVVGHTDGVAPGYKASLAWRAVDFSSETEFVIDARESSDSFIYTWSEAAVSPAEWIRTGLVVQRTKVRQTPFEIWRGVFATTTYKRATFGAYLLDTGEKHPMFVMNLTASF